MTTHPIVNGVRLTAEQEERIRQIDFLLKRALFTSREDAVLAARLIGGANVHSASKGEKILLYGSKDSVQAYINIDNFKPAPKPKPRTDYGYGFYHDPYDF